MTPLQYLVAALAAFAAGAVNALAGGGTLITFPTLTALGIPAVAANITSTVSLFPGYFGATWAQRKDLKGQKNRLLYLLPAALLGGLSGGIFLLLSGEKVFKQLIPYLILFAAFLLALSDPLRKRLTNQPARKSRSGRPIYLAAIPAIILAAIYGGYFGAGLSIIVLAFLALLFDDSLTRLNALKQAIAFATNSAAAIFFLFSGKVNWGVAAVMAVSALLGGTAGGKLAGRVNPTVLRWIVVSIGLIISIIFFMQ
jgi:uncharacterized membrane protein YfcA